MRSFLSEIQSCYLSSFVQLQFRKKNEGGTTGTGAVKTNVRARMFHGTILCYNIANNKVLSSHNTTCLLCWGDWQTLREGTALRENSTLACLVSVQEPQEMRRVNKQKQEDPV